MHQISTADYRVITKAFADCTVNSISAFLIEIVISISANSISLVPYHSILSDTDEQINLNQSTN